ncbi:MAG: DUF3307 domain-containing protein [Hyphomicrobiaceae bacterium]
MELPQIWQFIIILAVHWVADFILQSRWMAENKSTRLDALSLHVGVYTAVLATAATLLFGMGMNVMWFIAANAVLHFMTDFVTSKITSALWQRQNVHGFFAVVGLDQLLHQVALAATLVLLI